ncbi:MAG: hypothetical protein WAN11_10705 [Syntrophobacteraceae bacterium]
MKKWMAIAVVLMVFAFGVVVIHAQQTDMKDHGMMMMSSDCPMMNKAEGAKCAMCNSGKCTMAAGKCTMAAGKCTMHSHQGSETATVPEYFGM